MQFDDHDDNRGIFDVETDFARQFDLQSFVSDGKTGHLRKVCNNIYTLVLLLSIGIQILEIPICQKNSHVS